MAYDSYFLMREGDVAAYVRARQAACPALSFLDTSGALTCAEIGDGNLNYVFRLADAHGACIDNRIERRRFAQHRRAFTAYCPRCNGNNMKAPLPGRGTPPLPDR